MVADRCATTHTTSQEEADLLARSTKKVKGGDHEFTNTSSSPISYADVVDLVDDGNNGVHERRSHKETVLGVTVGGNTEKETVDDHVHWGGMNLEIVEKLHGGYECLEIVIPPRAEERLCWPWKQGLIVKLLGRRISFKAHENCLNQLWVKKGQMNIVDLGCDFFLVYLSR